MKSFNLLSKLFGITWLVYKIGILHISNEMANFFLFLCLLLSIYVSGMSLVQLLPKSLYWRTTFVLLFRPNPPKAFRLIIDFRAKKYWYTIRIGERRGQSSVACALEMLKKLFQPHNFGDRSVVEVGNVYISFLGEMKQMKTDWASHGWAISGDEASDVWGNVEAVIGSL